MEMIFLLAKVLLYGGLGDRHQQIVDGVATNYALDLAAGLTQVLDDGTNTYLYGNGRIAQAGSTTEYFLSDALGSVRQLVDPVGAVTLRQSYAPYGDVVSYVGTSQTDYAFTGEATDASGLTYLRARYYAPQDGRFISRDTWDGAYKRPLSLNRWNYVEGNPVNLTDSTGQYPSYPGEFCSFLPELNMHYIEKNVRPFLYTTGGFDTYTAAGIAVQCWRDRTAIDAGKWVFGKWDEDAGKGSSQISDNQVSTPWGQAIAEGSHGYGLLCYLVNRVIPRDHGEPIVSLCTVCKDTEYLDQHYGPGSYILEAAHDPSEMRWAVEYMRRRIKLVLDACDESFSGCRDTDKYIVAALAQNGPGFSQVSVQGVPRLGPDYRTPDYKLDWKQYFSIANTKDTQTQLQRFNRAILGLEALGWMTPNRDTNYINDLMEGNYR